MKLNRKLIGILIPFFILIFMTITPILTLSFGKTVILKTVPYDPTDAFRGDYVALSYDIESIDLAKFKKEDKIFSEFKNNDEPHPFYDTNKSKVYVVLKTNSNIAEVDYVTSSKKNLENKTYLSGTIDYINSNGTANPQATIKYSLDSYFVPENTGKKLEDLSRKGLLKAKIKVRNGYAILIKVSE